MLALTEKLLLLSIEDDAGEVIPFASEALRFGLAGAILAELSLLGKVTVQDKELILTEESLTGEELLDEVLILISDEEAPQKVTYWIRVLSTKKLKKKVIARLAAKNVIAFEEKHFAWVPPSAEGTPPGGSAKYGLKLHLRAVILAGEEPQPTDLILLSLLKACRMLDLVFTRDELKAARKKVDERVKTEVFGKAVTKAIAALDVEKE